MKILELQLIAFGPFTGLDLDLSAGEQGLHVLFGPNEAGKTSALRALKALLYGIPHLTADNFQHDNTALRIGGRLRHSDGAELTVIRRKGYRNTLLGLDGKPIADAALDKFLSGIREDLFSTMFGIDHAALVQGGHEILQGGGEVGQSLFAAGLGGVSLRKILQSFDSEAAQLFVPQGQIRTLNKALAEYHATKRLIADLSLSSGEWAGHDQELKKAVAERHRVQGELEHLLTEKHRLERLQAALPKIARRKELLVKQQEHGDVVWLPPEFPSQRQETILTLEMALQAERTAEPDLAQLQQDFEALAVPEALLEQGESITELLERLGSHRKASQDRSRLQGSRRQLESDAQVLLAKLRAGLTLEQARGLRPQVAHRALIQELGGQYQARLDSLDRATKDVQKSEEQLTGAMERLNVLEVPRDPRDLRREVARARQQGDLEEVREQTRLELQAESEQAQVDLKQLGLWSGTLEELEFLPIPPKETLDRFDTAFSSLGTNTTRLEEHIATLQADLGELDRALDELRLAGAVPSEAELTGARATRDQLWNLVRRAWVGREDVAAEAQAFDAAHNLPEAYESSVGHADGVADRLRREAHRVARQATLMAQRAKCARDLERLEAEKTALQDQLRHLHEAWSGIWRLTGITPLPPREMRAWVEKHERLRQRAERVREYRQKVKHLHERIQAHDTTLTRCLEGLGEEEATADETLGALLARSEALVETIGSVDRQRQDLLTQVDTLREGLQRAQRDKSEAAERLAQWRSAWQRAVADLGLEGDALPAEANAVLSTLDELLKKLDEADALAQRIEGIDSDARVFEADIRDLVARIAPDLLHVPVEQAAAQLNARFNKAQADAARQAELRKRIEEREADLRQATADIDLMRQRLDALCRQAGCSHPDELPAVEARSTQAQALHKDIEALEQQLLDQGEGATLDQLLKEAEAIDADAVPTHLSEIERQTKEFDQRRDELEQTIGRERTILEQMDGSARAAEAAEKAQAIVAEMRQGIDRYVRLRLASAILRREIERYRTNNQEPLLNRASELFTQLTLGAFAHLQTDFNERDQPVLVGVRPSGQRVGVEGMSDGTRDQLFLALRLASLERYLATSEPLPFIVDDILIRFDDQRAEATLKVLAQLSTQTQIIFFTHHWQLAESAQAVGGHSAVKIHRLGA